MFCTLVISNTRLRQIIIVNKIGLEAFLKKRLQSCQKAMGSCTAQCKMLLFCANTVVRESAKFELARLKKEEEEEENRFWRFGDFLVLYFRNGFSRHWESSWPGKHSKVNSKLS